MMKLPAMGNRITVLPEEVVWKSRKFKRQTYTREELEAPHTIYREVG